MILRSQAKRIITGMNRKQDGFTLIELLVAVAITGLISLGLMMAVFQVVSGNLSTSGEMKVIREVQNAGYWISHDTQMAQQVSTDDDPGTAEVELLTITWYEYTYHDDDATDRFGNGKRIIYTLVGEELRRDYYYGEEDEETREVEEEDYELQSSTFVAKYITYINCEYAGHLTLTVTASIGGWQPQSATRIYDVVPRPDVVF